jgi:antitoxin YefM
MTTLTATQARSNLYRLIDQVNESHKPIHITAKNIGAVLVSEEDWSAIQETLYLQSIPGMGKSIRKGLKKSLGKCDKELDW